jgi:tetratricopeptide (TPR) repeat protein
MMIGRGEDSIQAAESVSRLLPAELFGAPGMDFLQHYSIRPSLIRVRFARWDELMIAAEPPEAQLHSRAIWHYTRGRALAARLDSVAASAELEQLRAIAASAQLEGLRMEFNLSVDLLAVAENVLAGWVDAVAGQMDSAADHLYEAVRLEDALKYGEPPEWTMPARQDLGDILLLAGRHSDAEKAFREDLVHFPKNGWSLQGLSTALQAQGKVKEAALVEIELKQVWANGDVLVMNRSGE